MLALQNRELYIWEVFKLKTAGAPGGEGHWIGNWKWDVISTIVKKKKKGKKMKDWRSLLMLRSPTPFPINRAFYFSSALNQLYSLFHQS